MHSRGPSHSHSGEFPHADPESCWKRFKPFPSGLCVEKEGGSAAASRGPFADSWAPTGTSFTDQNKSKAGAGRAGEGERGHEGGNTCLPLLVSFSEAAPRALGPGFNPALASHFPPLSVIPRPPPGDLLSSSAKEVFPLKHGDNVRPDTG